MKDVEKEVMCVLLERLMTQNLITPKIFENARNRILGTFDNADFLCCQDVDRKEESHGYTQNPC